MFQSLGKHVENQKEKANALLIFFIVYPFGTFLYSLRNFGRTEFGLIPLAFFVLYGYSFIPIENSDGSKYEVIFSQYRDYTFEQYALEIQNTYTGKSRNPDIYAPTILFVVSRFTANPHFFFAAVALIYFAVFRKVFNLIVRLTPTKVGLHFFYFLGAFFIYNLSAGINGLRFPLAFFVFAYGALSFVIEARTKYFVLAVLACLIHFAFWLPCIVLLVFSLLPKSRYRALIYLLLLVAILANAFFAEIIFQNVEFFGEGVETKLSGYTREGFIRQREDHKKIWNWYVLFNMYSTYYFLIGALVISKLKTFKVKTDVFSNRLFIFVALLFVQALLSGNVVDSISNRYVIIFKFFGLVYFLYLTATNPTNSMLRAVTYVYVPLLILTVLVSLRTDSFTFSPLLALGNIFIILFFDSDSALPDLF